MNCSHNRRIYLHQLNKPFSLYWILLLNIAGVLIFILLLDRIVYPLCYTWVPSMLTRIGIGMCIGLITIICALTTEAVCYHSFNSANIVNINVYRHSKLFVADVPVGIVTPQFIIQAVAECLVLITSKFKRLLYCVG